MLPCYYAHWAGCFRMRNRFSCHIEIITRVRFGMSSVCTIINCRWNHWDPFFMIVVRKIMPPSCERLTAGRREPEAMMLMRQRVTVYYHSDQRMCSSKGDPFLDSRHLDHLRTVITTEQHNFLLLLKNKRQWTITEFWVRMQARWGLPRQLNSLIRSFKRLPVFCIYTKQVSSFSVLLDLQNYVVITCSSGQTLLKKDGDWRQHTFHTGIKRFYVYKSNFSVVAMHYNIPPDYELIDVHLLWRTGLPDDKTYCRLQMSLNINLDWLTPNPHSVIRICHRFSSQCLATSILLTTNGCERLNYHSFRCWHFKIVRLEIIRCWPFFCSPPGLGQPPKNNLNFHINNTRNQRKIVYKTIRLTAARCDVNSTEITEWRELKLVN